MKYLHLFERLVANSYVPEDQNENGCWIWTGGTVPPKNEYGRLSVRVPGRKTPKSVYAHRAMEIEVRRFMEDKTELGYDDTIDHRCLNTLCVNPDHWLVVTRAENTRLANERRRDART